MLNDFEAVGYGVSVVPEEDTVVLNDAPIVPTVGRHGCCLFKLL